MRRDQVDHLRIVQRPAPVEDDAVVFGVFGHSASVPGSFTLDTLSAHSSANVLATLPNMATTRERSKTIVTPWGAAHPVEQVTLQQRAGERRFATLVQLLELDRGERLVRFAYTTDGVSRRGPVTLKLRDLERLRSALAEHPGLAEALLGGGGEA